MPNLRTRDQGDSPEVSTILPVGSPSQHWDGLVAGWTLDQGNGARADVLGDPRWLLIDTDMAAVPGIIGNAMELVSLDQASTPDSPPGPDFPLVTGAITAAIWVRRTGSILGTGIFGRGFGPVATSSWSILTLDGTTVVGNATSGTSFELTTSLSLTLNTWHSLVLIKPAGASVMTLYIDDGSTTAVAASIGQINTGATTEVNFGDFSTGSGNMELDEGYIFHEEKDLGWVENHYNGGAGRQFPN